MPCKVCMLSIRNQLEQMKLEGKSISEIYKFCLENGYPEISYRMLQYHFDHHMGKSNKDILDGLYNILELFKHKIEEVVKTSTNISDSVTLIKGIPDINKALELIKEIKSQKSREEIFNLILCCLIDLPNEWNDILQQRLKLYEEIERENPRISPLEFRDILRKKGLLLSQSVSS